MSSRWDNYNSDNSDNDDNIGDVVSRNRQIISDHKDNKDHISINNYTDSNISISIRGEEAILASSAQSQAQSRTNHNNYTEEHQEDYAEAKEDEVNDDDDVNDVKDDEEGQEKSMEASLPRKRSKTSAEPQSTYRDDVSIISEAHIISSSSSSSLTTSASMRKPSGASSCRRIHDSYDKVSFISQGTYGLVFKAICKETREFVAVKQVKLSETSSGMNTKTGFPVTALREINVLLSLRHENIIRVREMVVGSAMDQIYMVMDYHDMDLHKCMRTKKQPFSTAEVKQLVLQLLRGVDHMHKHWYLHRDLKTSNLLYSRGKLCICDFGLARKYGSPIAPYTFEVVTLYYRAPELLLGSRVYSTALDIWSVGCIVGELLLGDVLFPGNGEADQLTKIFKGIGYPSSTAWPEFSTLPHAGQVSVMKTSTRGKLREMFPLSPFAGGVYLDDVGLNLVNSLLTANPQTRISSSAALEHPWLTTVLPEPASIDSMPRFD